MRFEQELTIAAPMDQVWDFLMDIPMMSSCIPGAENVEQIDESKYAVCVKQKVGPLSVRFECQVTVLSIDKSSYSASAQVSGRDTKLASGVKAAMTMHLEPRDGGVLMKMVADADIFGKIGDYGHGIIKKRAAAMTQEFGKCVDQKIMTTVA
jgi:carbon monoxide dehydrogenase subunit G